MIFKIDSMELTYEDFGRGPAVVVLHDRQSNQELRKAHFQSLAGTGYRVIIVNADGIGTLPASPSATESRSERVLALFNYLGIGRAVLIGIGQGGWVVLDLMERFPVRVAGASFVVSASLAAELRRRAASKEALEALGQGNCNPLKQAFLAAGPLSPAPRQLPRLQAWINRLRERRDLAARRPGRGSAERLAGFELPALFIEEETGASPSRESTPNRSRPIRLALRALSNPLQALFSALLPGSALFEEDTEDDYADSH